jgi:hypothetical protein
MDWYVARGGETSTRLAIAWTLSASASHIDEWLIGTRPSQGRGGFRDGARRALQSLRADLRGTGTVGHVELPAGFLGNSSARHCLAIGITWDRFLSRLWSERERRDRQLRSHLQRFRFCKLGARRRALGRRGHLPPLLMALWQLRRGGRLSAGDFLWRRWPGYRLGGCRCLRLTIASRGARHCPGRRARRLTEQLRHRCNRRLIAPIAPIAVS